MIGGRVIRSHYTPIKAAEEDEKLLVTLRKQSYGTMCPAYFYLYQGRHGEFVPVTWWTSAENGGIKCALFSDLTRFCNVAPTVTGPFFEDMEFCKYETVMLVADGVGILTLLPIMLAITSRKRHDLVQKERPFGDVARKVNLLWKINNNDQIRRIAPYFQEICQWEMGQIAGRHVHILEFHPDTTDPEQINKARRDQLGLEGNRQNWLAYNVAMFTEHVSKIIEHDSQRTPNRSTVISCGDAGFTRTIQHMVQKHMDSDNIIHFTSADCINTSSLDAHD